MVAFGLTLAETASGARVDVPAGDAARTLRIFARQSGVQLVYPVSEVRGKTTRRVSGDLPPRHALEVMLAGSGLEAVEDPQTGAFVVRPGPSTVATGRPAGTGGPAVAPPADGPAHADEGVVVLSPFEIRTHSDLGYRSANTVSATRVAMPISELPMTVSAFTEEFITDQKPYDLYDVVKWTPGVHQDNQSPQGWARYSVRGYTSASIQRNGFGSFRFIDATNIARVEVVKGPASLLYGQINPGGVINYITKRPEPIAATQVSASVGTHGYSRLMVDTTGPVSEADSSLLFRAIAMTETVQDFQEGSRGRKYLFAPSARWQINDRVSVVVDYERFSRLEDMITSGVPLVYEQGVAMRPYPGLPWDFNYAGRGDYQDFVSDALTLEFDARLGEVLHLRGTYIDAGWDMEWRATGQGATGLISHAAIDYFYPPSAGLRPPDAMIRRNRWEHQWGGERALQIDLAGVWNVGGLEVRPMLGAKWNLRTFLRNLQRNNRTAPDHPLYIKPWDLRDPSTWDRSVPFGVDALTWVANGSSASSGTSEYAVVSATAFEGRVHALAGYSRHEVSNDPTYDTVTGLRTPGSDRSRDVPQVGLLFKATPEASLFATYSESFLANATMLRVDNIPTTPALPSIGRGWEAGAKLEVAGGRVSGTISAYSVKAAPSGVITVTTGIDPRGTTLFTDIQGGSQQSDGFEAELLVAPTRDLQVFAAVGTCDATYVRHPLGSALDGTRLVAAPERVASLWCKYTLARGPASRVTVSGGFNHVGEMAYVGNNPRARLASYTTVDLGLAYAFKLGDHAFTADVLVKNVGNERYYASNSSWGFPRHAMFTLTTRF